MIHFFEQILDDVRCSDKSRVSSFDPIYLNFPCFYKKKAISTLSEAHSLIAQSLFTLNYHFYIQQNEKLLTRCVERKQTGQIRFIMILLYKLYNLIIK